MNKVKQYNIKVIPRKGGETEVKVFLGYDKEDAKKEAHSQGYQIISEDKTIVELEYGKNNKPIFYSKNISKKDILLFFELFSNLRNLPTLKQVEILKKQAKKYIMNLFYDDLEIYISKGKSLYDILSMDKWSKYFTHNQLELIKVGEQTQNLDETIKNLAEEQKNELEIRSALVMAAVYPLMIFVTLIIASIILFIYILPTMMALTGGIELPPLTQALFDVRTFILDYGLISLGILTFIVSVILILIQGHTGRLYFHKVLLILPGIKELQKSRIEMQISKILQFSSSAGMTPKDKVTLLFNGVNNLVYKEYFKEKINDIQMGGKLISIFSLDKMFSPQMQGYIETGDINHNLSELMDVHYQTTLKNIQKNVKLVQLLLNTMIIFLLGGIVGLFAGGILQLVLKLTESVL